MKTFLAILAIPAFVGLCGLALVANESAAVSGHYAQADQFLSSIVK